MKIQKIILFIFLLLSNKSSAYDGYLNIGSIYMPDSMTLGVGIGLGDMINKDDFTFKTYPIKKRNMYKYLGQDEAYFNSGQAYILSYEKRISSKNSDNMYYCYGYDIGGVYFLGNYFNEFHPLLLGRLGIGAKKEILKGEIYVENVLSIGIITYIKSATDLLMKFRPDITYEFPVYFGYKIYI
jgi:hypothetical protein